MGEIFFFIFGLTLGVIVASAFWLYEPENLVGFLRTVREVNKQQKNQEEK